MIMMYLYCFLCKMRTGVLPGVQNRLWKDCSELEKFRLLLKWKEVTVYGHLVECQNV